MLVIESIDRNPKINRRKGLTINVHICARAMQNGITGGSDGCCYESLFEEERVRSGW